MNENLINASCLLADSGLTANQEAPASVPASAPPKAKWIDLYLHLLALLLTFTVTSCSAEPPAATPPSVPSQSQPVARPPQKLAWKLVQTYPHDSEAFLQGLLWHNGYLYESTGQEGQSSLRKVDLITGKVLQRHSLSMEFFGEGLALVKSNLVQLTWTSKKGFVYDLSTFKQLREFSYDTQGWGLASDGTRVVMSDGSDQLYWLDPSTLKVLNKISVTANGKPMNFLNELEFVEGAIWANIWRTDLIAVIDPKTGIVTSYLDMAGILPAADRTGHEDVLNGIAYDPEKKRIFISGKYWPKMFEIQVLNSVK